METADKQADQHDALRERFRGLIEHRGMSINEAARGVGMSAPAVSSWLGGKYRGDNARLARLVGRWLDTEAETARMRIAAPGTHAELAVTTRVQGFAAHAQANRDCVLIYGAAGAGKTHALRRYCEEHAGAWYASMSPAVTTAAAALARIARVLEVGAGVTTGARLEDVVVGHLARRNAVLVVDEAHHLSPALLDELRCVHDAAECGLVLAGNDPLWSRLVATERARTARLAHRRDVSPGASEHRRHARARRRAAAPCARGPEPQVGARGGGPAGGAARRREARRRGGDARPRRGPRGRARRRPRRGRGAHRGGGLTVLSDNLAVVVQRLRLAVQLDAPITPEDCAALARILDVCVEDARYIEGRDPARGDAGGAPAERRSVSEGLPVRDGAGWGCGVSTSSAQHIWDALLRYGQNYQPYTRTAELAVCSVGTVRKHIRAWSLAGYVNQCAGLSGQYGGRARIAPLHRRIRKAPLIRYDCGGSLIYVQDPRAINRYTTINLNEDPPAVHHYDRHRRL